MERRAFSGREKMALKIIADGKCEICGKELPEGWHADHVEPYSKGGATDVINGQALCPACNLKKGATGMFKLRPWQKEAMDVLNSLSKRDISVQAPMGSGKTLFGKHMASESLRRGAANMVLILAPRVSIVNQWKGDVMDENVFGMKIRTIPNGQLEKNRIASEVNAIAITYQQVAAGRFYLRKFFDKYKVYVVLDELHYLADGNKYLEGIEMAVPNVAKRLGLTATPMRSDNVRIPTLNYEENVLLPMGTADYTYSVAAAVDDAVLRYPKAIFHDGMMQWAVEGERITAEFTADIPVVERSRRLRTAINPLLPYAKDFLLRLDVHMQGRQAASDKQNIEDDIERFRCKCIVFCRCISETVLLTELLREITTSRIDVFTSDDAGAHAKMEEWKTAKDAMYAFAVGMMHVGFDDGHVTDVAVLTTTTYAGWLYQMFGRALRNPSGGPEDAYMFAPRDPRFVEFYENWKDEMRAYILDAEDREALERERVDGDAFNPEGAEIGDALYLPDWMPMTGVVDEFRRIAADGSDQEIRDYIERLRGPRPQEQPDGARGYGNRTKILEDYVVAELAKAVRRSIGLSRIESDSEYYIKATHIIASMVGADGHIKGAEESQLQEMRSLLLNGFKEEIKNSDPREWTHVGLR